jgi:hypothetical protein
MRRKAVTSSRVTVPSALAIFAPRARTAMVKPTDCSGAGVVRSLSKTTESGSPLARADSASAMRVQIDMMARPYPALPQMSALGQARLIM